MLQNFMKSWGIDIACITEPNVHWGKVSHKDTWYERSAGWFQSRRLAVAYNTQRGRLSTVNQYGGTMTLARDDISHRAIQSGYDDSGMGRWSYIRFRGKRKNVTRVMTCYCPVRSTAGPNTVYSQQLQILGRDPIKAFWGDLEKEVHKCQQQGEQVILLGDWNTDARDKQFCRWKRNLGLIDPITKRHGKRGPSTYNRGTRVIDSILVSSMLRFRDCGYLSFGQLPGDHRGIWVDITLDTFIGYRAPPVPSYQARRLKTEDPRVMAKYRETLEDDLIEAQIFTKARILQRKVQLAGRFTKNLILEYEKLDSIRTKAMHRAERKCRKLFMGGYVWSPTLQKARDEILLWILVRRKLLGRKVGTRRILRLKRRLKIANTLLTLPQCNAALDQAFKRYKVIRRQDKRLRATFREDLAQARAQQGNTSLATEIRAMGNKERQRSTSRRVKAVLGKNTRTGTSKIEILHQDGTITEVTQPVKMVGHIIKENQAKYNQNVNCPLFQDGLLQDLGLLGDGPEVEKVLNGTYVPPASASWATKRWLRQMKIPNKAVRDEITTSLNEYRKGWRMAKERTASGELHMGHFKVGAAHKRIGWLNFVMAVLPYTAGYVPLRWRKGTDVMILKEEENYLLHKLRTIVLYEADFNTENKRLGRDAMKLAIKKNKIAKEQFSRPGRSSQENVLCKRLLFDYCRAQKKPFGMCACDLKSCYDRIVHTAASIALQRIGVPLGKIKTMFGAVQRLVHHVRTLFGTSKESYGGDTDPTFVLPPQGMGQGHGTGPTIWSILSSTIFEILHEEGFASDFMFSISKGLFHLCGFSYVDDCDLLYVGTEINIVAEKLKGMIAMWDDLMEVNGGAIAPDKCWWYLVDFQWRNGKWYMVNGGKGHSLTVRDKDKTVCTLPNLPPSTAKQMLGVFLSPDGDESTQLAYLSEKAQKWMEFIRVGGLDWTSCWIALKTTIWKSLEYPLPATTFTKDELSSITGPLYKTVLPRCGYASSFPRDVLHGPKELQGLGLDNLYDKQYIRHVKDILDYCHRNSTSDEILRLAIESAKLEAGIGGPLFQSQYKVDYFNTTNSWVAATHNYCIENRISFDEKCGNLHKRRHRDHFIMESAMAYGLDKSTLLAVNRCRLYLQVNLLSDISTGDGRRLSGSSLRGVRIKCNSYNWPDQQLPNKQDWNSWRRVLHALFAPTSTILTKPLGEWLSKSHEEHYHDWMWWLHPDGRLLFHDTDWRVLQPVTTIRRYPSRDDRVHFRLDTDEDSLLLPPDFDFSLCERTVVETTEVPFQYVHTGSMPLCESLPWILDWLRPLSGSRATGIAFLRNLDDNWITQYLHATIPTNDLTSLLVRGDLVGVSDGSFHPKHRTGSMGWCLATKQGRIVLKGGGLIPGDKSIQGSYRSEAGGLLALVTVIQALEKHHGGVIPVYSMTLACDGESALYRSLTGGRDKLNTSVKHSDLLSRTHDRKDVLRSDITPRHVYGHRDDLSTNLTVLEKLNVRMDTLAKAIALVGRRQNMLPLAALPLSPDGYPIVRIRGKAISSDLEKTLLYEVSSHRIQQWWIKKNRFRAVDQRFIDWECLAKCMKSCGPRFHRFIPKWVTGQIAVGVVMAKRGARAHNRCPRCDCAKEDTLHVLRCQDDDAVQTWSLAMKNLKEWCIKVDTHPSITSTLIPLLLGWQESLYGHHFISSTWDRSVKSAFVSQARLGWQSFLSGLLSTEWASLQDRYYQSLGSRRSGLKWSSDLSRRLWEAVYSMWDHRNTVMHRTGKITEFSGGKELLDGCLFELSLGFTNLDPIYHPYLDISRSALLKESTDYKRNWFSIIRQARENAGQVYTDLFSTCQSSRDWVGLSKLQCS